MKVRKVGNLQLGFYLFEQILSVGPPEDVLDGDGVLDAPQRFNESESDIGHSSALPYFNVDFTMLQATSFAK